jgi:hypothetical protein
MTMDRDETLVDIVERLNRTVGRLEILLEGDAALGLRGVTTRVQRIEENLDLMQSAKPSALQWTIGYLLFGLFVAIVSHSGCQWLGISVQLALIIGVFVFVFAGVFFVSGLGWLKWR